MPTSMSPVHITDLVLRDAHQSLLATRMRTEDMLPIAEKLNRAGCAVHHRRRMSGERIRDSTRFRVEDHQRRCDELAVLVLSLPPKHGIRMRHGSRWG